MAILGRLAAACKAVAAALRPRHTETRTAFSSSSAHRDAGFARYWKRMCARQPSLADDNNMMRMSVGEFRRKQRGAYDQAHLDDQAVFDELKSDTDKIFQQFNEVFKTDQAK